MTTAAHAAEKEVKYGPVPEWVVPQPVPAATEAPTEAAYRMVFGDNQIRMGANGMEVFQSMRVHILKPQALQAGNLSVTWNPAAGGATVHWVRIIRDGKQTDVLAETRFNVIQREGFLENAMLNGNLTATMQVPGLQLGDELEFAVTTINKDPTLGDHLYGFAQGTQSATPGDFRIRFVWPRKSRVKWRSTPDISNLSPVAEKEEMALVYELKDPHAPLIAQGAPDRVNLRRFIEISDFETWQELSTRIWTLIDKAAVLKADSPLQQEIAHIKKASPDPSARLKAALQLVQDRVRYVYIGLNGGNYTPATTDETWDRKFGDCKAKTVLLLSILRQLDIPAEAVMVDATGGDGLNEHLPSPLAFNHVLVRATVDKTVYWLDGTRQGDARLTTEPPGPYRWVLPVRSSNGDLERVPLKAPPAPLELTYVYADASKGFGERAQVEMQTVMRGDVAMQLRTGLSVLSSEDVDRALLQFWRQGNPWLEPSTASWHYDEDRGTLLLAVKGTAKLDWEGNDSDGHTFEIFGAGFYKPDELHRPADQDQNAPWKLTFPRFRCWATAIRLPPEDNKWKWDYQSPAINAHTGGVHYWRAAELRDGVMRTVMSSDTEVPELTAEQALQLNKDIPAFNYYKSTVFQIATGSVRDIHLPEDHPLFPLDMDWSRTDVPCGAN